MSPKEGKPVAAVRAETWRWLAQRASAAVLVVCVLVHLFTMIYAVRQGLTAEAMLARAHATLLWPVFYAVFVVAAAVHAPLGLRVVLDEWAGLRGRALDVLLAAFALALLAAGGRAVYAMTLA